MHWEHLHQTCVFVSSVPSRHDSSREVDLLAYRYRIVQTSIVPPRKCRFVCHRGHTSCAPSLSQEVDNRYVSALQLLYRVSEHDFWKTGAPYRPPAVQLPHILVEKSVDQPSNFPRVLF